MAYKPTYTKPYTDGWKNLPEETTPITAETLNGIDSAIESIESQLKKTTTIYDETAISNGRTAGTTVGTKSIAYGNNVTASASYSQAFGNGTTASSPYQHVQGKYNVADAEDKYAHIVGSGSSSSDRKNIHTLDWQGNAEFAGNVTDGNGDSIASVKGEIPSEEILDIDFSTYFS